MTTSFSLELGLRCSTSLLTWCTRDHIASSLDTDMMAWIPAIWLGTWRLIDAFRQERNIDYVSSHGRFSLLKCCIANVNRRLFLFIASVPSNSAVPFYVRYLPRYLLPLILMWPRASVPLLLYSNGTFSWLLPSRIDTNMTTGRQSWWEVSANADTITSNCYGKFSRSLFPACILMLRIQQYLHR